MALDGVLHHNKTIHLARLLGGVDPCMALGPLEALWFVTRRRAPSGAIGRMSNQAIADEMRWSGNPETLIAALLESGWLDESKPHRLVVHDWHEHADDTTHSRLFRKVEHFWNGKRPRAGKCDKEEKARILEEYQLKEARPAANLWEQESVVAAQHHEEVIRKQEESPNVVPFARLPAAPNGALPEPEPVPVPEPQTPYPLAGKGGVRKQERALESLKRTAAGEHLHRASQQVVSALGITGTYGVRVQTSVVMAIEAECKRVDKPPEAAAMEIAGRMVESWRDYLRNEHLLRFKYGHMKFFEGGHWTDDRTWPWDQQRIDRLSNARVGMR